MKGGAKVCRCQVVYMDQEGCCHLFLPFYVDSFGVCHSCFDPKEQQASACTPEAECNSAKFHAHIGSSSPVVLACVSQEDQLKHRVNAMMHSVLDELVKEVKERKRKAIVSSILTQVLGSSPRFAEKVAMKEHDVLSRDLSCISHLKSHPHRQRHANFEGIRCRPKVHKFKVHHLQQPRALSY